MRLALLCLPDALHAAATEDGGHSHLPDAPKGSGGGFPCRVSWTTCWMISAPSSSWVDFSNATGHQRGTLRNERKLLRQTAPVRANRRFMFHDMVTSFHSPRTFSRPRSENCQKPNTDLMMLNTGSGVCLRRWIGGGAVLELRIMVLAGLRDQRLDPSLSVRIDVAPAEISCIGQQSLGPAECL
jgi:hypothetical protein